MGTLRDWPKCASYPSRGRPVHFPGWRSIAELRRRTGDRTGEPSQQQANLHMNRSARLLAASRPIKPAYIFAADLVAAALAPLLAHLIRKQEAFDLTNIMSYWAASMLCSGTAFLLFGVGRSIWRYFSWRELMPLTTAVVTAVSSASFLAFTLDRMEAVSRAEPLLHGSLLLAGLILIRVLARHAERSKGLPRYLRAPGSGPVRQALVIGTSPLADIYLRMVDEMAGLSERPVDVIGIVAEKPRHVGRTLRGRLITGTLSDLEATFAKLSVHGAHVDMLVLAVQEKYVPEAARAFLQGLEAAGTQVIRLPAVLGAPPTPDIVAVAAAHAPAYAAELGTWPGKRIMDIVLSVTLAVVLSPVIVLVWVCVLADVGSPVIFWQLRPGFLGVATRFYKFRTMRHAEGAHVGSDEERISGFGRLLRRTRLDEVPQLLNIMLGQMSIIGPRPLLLRDLHDDGADRIRMRPGVTGWAQINGGKLISPQDKMALDLWYAHHASLRLDLLILWRTVLTVVRGDRVWDDAVERARLFMAQRRGHTMDSAPVFDPRRRIGGDNSPYTSATLAGG